MNSLTKSLTKSLTFLDLMNSLDPAQDIEVGSYSGPLEKMSVGQLLLLQDRAILSLKCDSRLIVSLESDEM